jgi:hypothetical protein
MRGNLSPRLREVMEPSDAAGNVLDDDAGLPSQAEGEYRAYGLPANKLLVSVHFITPDGTVRSFQYRHLDSDTRFDHRQITLQFLGFRPVKIVIEGRHLRQLYDYLHQDRTPWVMQAARDFSEEGQPVVSNITFIDLAEGER